MRRLGLDFDNTIVCYDGVFHRAAREAGLIPAHVPQNKNAVRDHMRAQGQESAWIALQGEVYGPRLQQAEPFPGLLDFLRAVPGQGWEVCIVSHKTQHPFAGPRYDLHEAARSWIARHLQDLVAMDQVHLELTKDAKLSRIAALKCHAFVDDLPEILLAPNFPAATRAYLFDPSHHFEPQDRYVRLCAWSELQDVLLSEEALP